MMTRRSFSRIVLAGSMTVFAASLAAATADVVAARQAGFKQIGRANKAVADELRAGQPSIPTIRANAKILAASAQRVPSWFPKGSGPAAGVKTGAAPAIWQNPAGFRTASTDYAAAARALDAAAATGDAARIRTAFAAVGRTCKGCHDSFRVRD